VAAGEHRRFEDQLVADQTLKILLLRPFFHHFDFSDSKSKYYSLNSINEFEFGEQLLEKGGGPEDLPVRTEGIEPRPQPDQRPNSPDLERSRSQRH
jgi:hypothetical protein